MIVLATQNETRGNGKGLETVALKYRSLRADSHWCGKRVKEGNERSGTNVFARKKADLWQVHIAYPLKCAGLTTHDAAPI